MKAFTGKQPDIMKDIAWKYSEMRVVSTIKMCLADKVMYHVMDEESSTTT